MADNNRKIKIAITGPESTGKSELAKNLAKHFDTSYVPEFARAYIDKLNRPYNQDDILEIAKNQLKKEQSALKTANKFLFCDTELIVTKIWSMHKYDTCHPWILENIEKNTYDLFLLCDIDLPWEYDTQREHPHLRDYFLNYFIEELKNYGFHYRLISGTKPQERLQNAINSINQFFNLSSKC